MKDGTPLWREAHFQVKMHTIRQHGTNFGCSDLEKWHAAVARSTCASQNAQNATCSELVLKVRSRKRPHRCGAKHICKRVVTYVDTSYSICRDGSTFCPEHIRQKHQSWDGQSCYLPCILKAAETSRDVPCYVTSPLHILGHVWDAGRRQNFHVNWFRGKNQRFWTSILTNPLRLLITQRLPSNIFEDLPSGRKLADVQCNDAFSTAHHAHSSMAGDLFCHVMAGEKRHDECRLSISQLV